MAKKLLGAQQRRWKSRHVDSSDLLPIVIGLSKIGKPGCVAFSRGGQNGCETAQIWGGVDQDCEGFCGNCLRRHKAGLRHGAEMAPSSLEREKLPANFATMHCICSISMTQCVLLPPSRCCTVTAVVTNVLICIILRNDGVGLMRFAHLADQSDHLQ